MKPATKKCLIRLRAANGAWLSGNRLFEACGTRYSARVFELRHEFGFRIERRSSKVSAVDDYRLIEKPQQLAWTA